MSTTDAARPLRDLVHPSWAQALAPVEPVVSSLGDFLRGEVATGRGYLPAGPHVLRAFDRPLDAVRVLIVGQDPYPTPGHAVGLSFSVAADTQPVPRSLANIFTELEAVRIPKTTEVVRGARAMGDTRVVEGVQACIERNHIYREMAKDPVGVRRKLMTPKTAAPLETK